MFLVKPVIRLRKSCVVFRGINTETWGEETMSRVRVTERSLECLCYSET